MTTLGERLRKSRDAKGWQQKYVCEKLGLSSSTISGYEKGDRRPNAEILSLLAELYGVSIDYLVNGIDKLSDQEEETIELEEILLEANKKITLKGIRLTDKERKRINDTIEAAFWDEISGRLKK